MRKREHVEEQWTCIGHKAPVEIEILLDIRDLLREIEIHIDAHAGNARGRTVR